MAERLRLDPPAWAVLLGCTVVAAAFTWPVLSSDGFGINDWDLQLLYGEAARRSLLVYHQLPDWNPYYCGGSALLANPSSTFLNPLFILSLITDVVHGARLAIFAHQVIGMMGAWLVAKKLGARGPAAFIAPVVFGLSSVYSLHIATGHIIWLGQAFLPWAVLFTVGAIEADDWSAMAKQAIGASIATSLILFTGNGYYFIYQCVFASVWGVLTACAKRPAWRPLAGGAAVALGTLLVAAVKLVPMSSFLRVVAHYDIEDESFSTLENLWLSLVSRDQSLTAHAMPGVIKYRWWEYGAYVGLVPLALALFGAVVTRAKNWRWNLLALFFLFVSLGSATPAWPLVRSIPGVSGLRVPSRAIVYVVLAVAVLGAAGAQWLIDRWPKRPLKLVTAVVVGLLLIDFFAVSRPVLDEAFALPAVPLAEAGREAPYEQVRAKLAFVTRTNYTEYLEHTVQNQGVITCYERLHVPVAAKAGQPLATLDGTPVQAEFSPNRISVDVPHGGLLVVNQNYDEHWRSSVGEVVSSNGVLSVTVPSDGKVVLTYRPARWGAWVTLISLVAAVVWWVRQRRRAPQV